MNGSQKLLEALLLSRELGKERWAAMPMGEWFIKFKNATSGYERAIDRAFLAGCLSSNVGFAFAGAYQSAIEALFLLEESLLASVCVTEVGGNHPRAINTRLYYDGAQLRLMGEKSFVSGANDAGIIYVACRDEREGNGIDAEGRPLIKMLALNVGSASIDVEAMPSLGFLPEITHGKVKLDLEVDDSVVLPGDGYLNYVKAFRTYEDLHVCAAIVGYRLGEAMSSEWGVEAVEQHIVLILALREISTMDLRSSAAHIALSSCRRRLDDLIAETNVLFEDKNNEAYVRWQRDSRLLKVASKAHGVRTEKAWQSFIL